MRPAPFVQTVLLPILPGSFNRTLDIYRPFADHVYRKFPGALEWSLFKTHDSTTGQDNMIVTERYVSAKAHDAFIATEAYQRLLNDTAEAQVLSGVPVATVVEQVGGFLNRDGR
ncbi:hypothetical protein GGR58DRAFT_456107 [Xylaria digitata]|nr:hypothetical protein GGR58DRAFT_456107 [Xylaria digitata]